MVGGSWSTCIFGCCTHLPFSDICILFFFTEKKIKLMKELNCVTQVKNSVIMHLHDTIEYPKQQ